ncbi:F0F1 ATP synthase subunit gamma, partial [bacterium]|nr:F0F1 ATP synthase subunit gamma [bacterium]
PIEPSQNTNTQNENEEEYEVFNNNFVLEPSSQEYTDDLYQKIIYSRFFTTFMELKATEYSTRMIAMQNANKSASDMIERFTLKYNNARQAAITQEIAEIVGGNL